MFLPEKEMRPRSPIIKRQDSPCRITVPEVGTPGQRSQPPGKGCKGENVKFNRPIELRSQSNKTSLNFFNYRR